LHAGAYRGEMAPGARNICSNQKVFLGVLKKVLAASFGLFVALGIVTPCPLGTPLQRAGIFGEQQNDCNLYLTTKHVFEHFGVQLPGFPLASGLAARSSCETTCLVELCKKCATNIVGCDHGRKPASEEEPKSRSLFSVWELCQPDLLIKSTMKKKFGYTRGRSEEGCWRPLAECSHTVLLLKIVEMSAKYLTGQEFRACSIPLSK